MLHRISIRKILLVIVLMGFIGVFVNAQDKYVFLNLKKSGNDITLVSSSVFEGHCANRIKNPFGSLEYVVRTTDGLSIVSDLIKDPCVVPFDFMDGQSGMILKGGTVVLDDASFSVRIPFSDALKEISFYQWDNPGIRGALLSRLSLENIQKRSAPVPADVRASIEIFQGDSADNRVNYCCFSEGYTQAELNSGKFKADLKIGIDHHFTCPPYSAYKKHFSVWAISVPSTVSGLGGYFGSVQSGRLVYITGTSKVTTLLQQLKPDWDMVLVLVNTTSYGGAGATYATATVNSTCGELIAHETGHGYALLADEYDYAGASAFESVNATQETNKNNVRWNIWFASATPIPTPETSQYSGVVGLFEGAMYNTTGWYRPKLNCKMNTLNTPFCEVCIESIIARAYKNMSPIESKYPTQQAVNYTDISGRKITITPLQPVTNTVSTTWTVNGVVAADNANELDLTKVTLNNGNNTIKAFVTDKTDLVKIPVNLPVLKDTATWTVNYNPSEVAEQATHKQIAGISMNLNKNGSPRDITFQADGLNSVSVQVINSKGGTVRTLVSGMLQKGTHTLSSGMCAELPNGIFYVSLKSGKNFIVRRIRIIR